MSVQLAVKKKTVTIQGGQYTILQNVSSNEARDVDTKSTNKWKWAWLTEKDFSTSQDFLSDYIVKIDKDGSAFCLWCETEVSYGGNGKRNC